MATGVQWAVVFISISKDVETKIVEFGCMPWQAPNGGCVAQGSDSAEVSFYVNELSDCRWSFKLALRGSTGLVQTIICSSNIVLFSYKKFGFWYTFDLVDYFCDCLD